MKRLTPKAWARATRFVQEHARPLEQALWAYWFGGAERDRVVAELARFQNFDGGFGHGLEPDFWLPASSPLATTVGLQYADRLDLPSSHPLVTKAVRYLLGSLDPHELRWPAVPEAVNLSPHAPWWHVDPATGRSAVEATWANPSAEVVGYLWQHARLVPTVFRDRLTERALSAIRSASWPIGLHDFLCWERCARFLPAGARAEVTERLRSSLPATVEASPAAWAAYGAEPLTLVPAPDALFYPELRALIEDNLDYRIDAQGPEGGWWPNWAWNQYPQAWEDARRAWAGILTVRTLKTLRDYGRL